MKSEVDKNIILTFNSNLIELQGVVPSGVYIDQNKYGNSLFASRSFKKGDFIYKGKGIDIGDQDPNISIKLYLTYADDETRKEIYDLQNLTHAVSKNNTRILYFFDSFTNHSCDPNIYSLDDANYYYYSIIAVKDINPGDELLDNYFNYEYDCFDKNILKCECKAENCVGQAIGFKYLSHEQKKNRINLVDYNVLNVWAEEFKYKPGESNECVVLDNLLLPDGIALSSEDGLVSTKKFNSGEILFEGGVKDTNEKTIVVAIIEKRRIWVDVEDKKYYGLATFIKNLEKSNVEIKMISDDIFKIVAVTNIDVNEELTCKR
jgi:hypothetical protein